MLGCQVSVFKCKTDSGLFQLPIQFFMAWRAIPAFHMFNIFIYIVCLYSIHVHVVYIVKEVASFWGLGRGA